MTPQPSAVVILAAGEGTRMKSSTPKVLHEICGRSLVGHVVASAQSVAAERIVVVVGHAKERVERHLAELSPDIVTAVQAEQNGTGHAVRMALQQLAEQDMTPTGGPVIVAAGDAPLLGGEVLELLLAEHTTRGAAVTVLSAVLSDPAGYGRVVRNADDSVSAIVEHRDADDYVLGIDEVNSGTYAFDPEFLAAAIDRLSTDNSQGEEYLTDLVGLARADGLPVAGVAAPDPNDIMGVNNRVQLAEAAAVLRDRINRNWMLAGVTVADPANTYIDVDVELEPDVTLLPGTFLQGATTVASGAVVGPDTTLIDTEVGPGARVDRAHCLLAQIGADVEVGPFTRLRPGTDLAAGAKAGSFVEIKNSHIGPGAKVPHLSYVGDADVGAGSNIGAATVVVNYDGVAKHRTVVGEQVRIGSDTMLVAPVEVGDGAYTAAGSVITEDVPAGALAIARGRQRNIAGWVETNRAGSASAEAAAGHEEGDQ